jgi:hypothetical protein
LNGTWTVTSVNSPANTMTINGVDMTAATGTLNAGVVVEPAGSLVHETIQVPSSATWINPNQFQIVLAHQNRLWFADSSNLAVYYLPLQQKAGTLGVLPMNALFRRGGSIRAMYTWTLDGGAGMQDQLVVFTTDGEAAIFQGVDPTDVNNWQLKGIYRCDSPMTKRCVANWGGELYVMFSSGVLPMSTMLRAESEKLGTMDKAVYTFFYSHAVLYRTFPGWQLIVNPYSNRLICNIPHGPASEYHQLARQMPQEIWSMWEGVPARAWGWLDPDMWFGDDAGNIFKMNPSMHSDNGAPIDVDVQCAWNQFSWPGLKDFKLIRAHIVTDGTPKLRLTVNTDYDYTAPINQPDITVANIGTAWDTGTWDVDPWAGGGTPVPLQIWQGCGGNGVVGGVRLTARVLDATTFDIYGFDVVYERGALGVG